MGRDLQHWIPDTVSSRIRDPKYAHTIDFYWHIKVLLRQLLETKRFQSNAILEQLNGIREQLRMMDNKQAALAREVWGVELKVEVLLDGSHPATSIHINSDTDEY